MSVGEAHSYINGFNRRHRQPWEQSRALCRLVYKVLSGEDLEWKFPWDDDNDEEANEVTEEQLDALRKKSTNNGEIYES